MQAHTKLFYLIEAEGTEREKGNKSGSRATEAVYSYLSTAGSAVIKLLHPGGKRRC